jgi:hypothetical protein
VRDVEAGVDRLSPQGAEQGDTTTEPSIAVNPSNPKNAVTCYQEGRVDGGGDEDNGCATTFDGGKTWRLVDLPGITPDAGDGPFDRASDAVVAFGPDNVVYANSLAFEDTGNALRSAIVTNVSHDGGKTWSEPYTAIDDQGGGLNDKNWIGVDLGEGDGHHYGRVYLVWDRVAPVLVSYSDDEGVTWTPPNVVYSGQGIGSLPLIMPNGDLSVVFSTFTDPIPPTTDPESEGTDPDKMVIATAVGAGRLPTGAPLDFAPPTTIHNYNGNDVRGQRAGPDVPTAAVDDESGRIYVSWSEGRYRTKKRVNATNDVVVTSSDDGGVTWTPLKKVNPGTGHGRDNHYNSMIAVGPKGVLRVAYLQRREETTFSDSSNFVDTYFQESRDGGQTFTPPLRVNTIRADVRFAAFSRDGAFFGDYNQMAVAGSWTYIARCVSYKPNPAAPAAFPPKVHHQRTFVAVVDSDAKAGP